MRRVTKSTTVSYRVGQTVMTFEEALALIKGDTYRTAEQNQAIERGVWPAFRREMLRGDAFIYNEDDNGVYAVSLGDIKEVDDENEKAVDAVASKQAEYTA